jgi:hypothetical protein
MLTQAFELRLLHGLRYIIFRIRLLLRILLGRSRKRSYGVCNNLTERPPRLSM